MSGRVCSKKTGGKHGEEKQNPDLRLGDKSSDNFFLANFLLLGEQNQFLLGITKIGLKALTPRSFRRGEIDGVEFLYL